MTKLNIEELKAAALGATPGPWNVCQHLKSVADDAACTCGYRGVIYGPDENHPMAICQPGHDKEIEDQEGLGPIGYSREQQILDSNYIAFANPTTILALLERLQVAEDAEKLLREIMACTRSDPARGKPNAGKWTTINARTELIARIDAAIAAKEPSP